MTHSSIALQWFGNVNLLTILSLIIALMSFSIGFYAFGKIQRTKGSRLMLGLCLTIGIWVFASAFIFSANPESGVWFWYYVQSFGFIPMWPILIHFFTVISGLDKTPGRLLEFGSVKINLNFPNASVFAQYALAIALHIWILTGAGEPAEYVRTAWGLRDTPNVGSPCVRIFVFMTLFWYAEGIVLLAIFWKRAHRPSASVDMRKQSEVISMTGVLFGGLTILVNIILPMLDAPIPAFGSLFIGIWIMSIAYAVARHNLGALDEQIVGQKAFNFSEEPMVVTDTLLNVLFCNRAFSRAFERMQPGANRKITEYLTDENGDPPDARRFLPEGVIPTLSAPAPDGSRRFYNVKASFIYNRREFDRILFILSDITEITTQKQVLEYLVNEQTKEINRQLEIAEKYTQPSLVRVIQSGGDPTHFEPSSRNLAIMFADIRDFTRLSRNLSSADTIRLLNSYFSSMNECIVHNGGEIDKLIGDAIMALFESADDAVTASIGMIRGLDEYNQAQRIVATGITAGIGIAFGQVTQGNIGSREKLDFTVIGDPVNAASRFEALTKRYQLPIVVSEDVVAKLGREYRIRFIDNVLVKGRDTPTKLYEIFDYDSPEITRIKLANRERLEEAFAAYAEGDFESAIRIYVPLNEQFGKKDPLLEFYAQRSRELRALQQLGKLGPWNGTWHFTDK